MTITHRTRRFDWRFSLIEDNGLLPGIIERLEGTTPRLQSLLVGVERASAVDAAWSISQEVGDLIDLEPLWLQRAHDIMRGEPTVRPPRETTIRGWWRRSWSVSKTRDAGSSRQCEEPMTAPSNVRPDIRDSARRCP